jgi:RHS repeat-associated protein
MVTTSYAGKTTTVTDQSSNKRVNTSDGLGRLTQVVEDPSGLNYTTVYAYDALDNLRSVNQSGQSRTFSYDSLKRLTSSTNPETGTISYAQYDGNSNLLSKTDNRQVTTSYYYDALNRITSKTYSSAGTPSVAYTYCNPTNCSLAYGWGHLVSVTTSAGNSTQYTGFSPAGRVISHQQVIGSSTYPFTYGYALVGNLVGEQYPSSRSVTLGYGYANEPLFVGGSLTNAQGNQTSTTYVAWVNFAGFKETYRSLGSLDALVLNRGYNSREQLTSMTLHNWNNSDNSPNYVQFMMNYYYGGSTNNGNLLLSTAQNSPSTVATPSQSLSQQLSQSYSYDTVNRLTGVSDTSYARTMCYDAYGNGWVIASVAGSTPVPGNAPQILNGSCPATNSSTPYIATNNQQAGVSYDAAGNAVSYGGDTLIYDAENRMSSITSPSGGVLARYQYDGDGRRISKTASGVTTNYVYDVEGRLTAEYVGGSLSKEYIRMHNPFIPAGTELVAIENAPGNGAPCTTCFVISDDLGSVRLTANNDGSAVARHDYTPFGEEVLADSNRPSAVGFDASGGAIQRFTGKERDSESGLDYFGARYYGSALGRFTSPDWSAKPQPIPYATLSNPQSLNLYVYALDNPMTGRDLDGHNLWDDIKSTARALTGTATQLLNDGLQRIGYTNSASSLSGPGASAERKALQSATYSKLSPVGQAITDAAKAARSGQLDGKTAEQLVNSASRTSSAMNSLGNASAVVGAAGVALGVGSVAIDVANAPAGQRLDTAVTGGSQLGGSLVGAEIGAEVGAVGGPWGAFAGSILGGFGGTEAVKSLQTSPQKDPQTLREMGIAFP